MTPKFCPLPNKPNPSGCVRRNGRDKQPRRRVFVVPFSNLVSTIIRTSMAVPLSMDHQHTQTPPGFAHSRQPCPT